MKRYEQAFQEALTPEVLAKVEAAVRERWRRRQEEAVAIRAMKDAPGRLLRQLGMGDGLTFREYLETERIEAQDVGHELQASAFAALLRGMR